ncbi:rho-related GTP-binding protein RhoF isoform X1 [Apus apus]|uniref:rho-related GTP-binding protein RhoF isoform X1 n=1 Tax=Apus apus TaxID=8895 RepID=UPI0021F84408|nr:rho-related GTP-binding protein RhoF isoform X1 [Apus apus]
MEAANGALPEAAAGGSRGSAAVPSGKKEVKVVIVGDGGCGKTSLLLVFAKGAFPEQYAPSVFEKYTTSVTVGKKEITLNLYDTAGQEDYDRLRPLSYQNTNVVLICYDVMNPTSYDNVAAKKKPKQHRKETHQKTPPKKPQPDVKVLFLSHQWYPEVNHFCQGVPLVLIGCKTDLRKDKEQLRKLRASKQEPITYNQGEAACQQINAEIYLECSAKCRENIESVFKEATTIALNAMKKAKRQKKQTVCSVL